MKSKIFAVVMAVMALVSCMCMPALAATNVPVVNGQSFSASHWTDDNGGELQYLEIEHGVTYTITTDPSITKLDLWIYKTASRANGSLTFVDGVAEYTCTDTNVKSIVILCGDAENRPTVTVSWPRPPEPTASEITISSIDALVLAAIGWVSAVCSIVFGTPILLIFTVLPLIGLGVGIFKRIKGV